MIEYGPVSPLPPPPKYPFHVKAFQDGDALSDSYASHPERFPTIKAYVEAERFAKLLAACEEAYSEMRDHSDVIAFDIIKKAIEVAKAPLHPDDALPAERQVVLVWCASGHLPG